MAIVSTWFSSRRVVVVMTALVVAVVGTLAMSSPAHAAPAWTAPFGVAFDSYEVAMSPDGTTVYAGASMVGGFSRATAQVRPPGGPASPLQLLSAPGVNASLPAVAAGPDGRFVAAWSESGVLQTAVMLPGTLTFGDVVSLPSAGDQAAGSAAVAVDGAGTANVLWSTSQPTMSGGTVRVRAGVRPATGAPSSEVLDQVSYSLPQRVQFLVARIAVSDAGAAIASWNRSDSASMPVTTMTTHAKAALRRPGQPFGPPIVLDTGSSDGSPPETYADAALATMTPGGDAAVVWGHRTYNGPTSSFVVRFRSGTPAGGLDPVQVPSAGAGTSSDQPAVALASDGRALVGFRSEISGVYRPQVAVRAAGGGDFTTIQTLATSGAAASKIDIAPSESGQVAVVFSTYDSATGKAGVQAAVAPPAGLFGSPVPLASGLSSLAGQGLAASPAGDAVATWRHVVGAAYQTTAAGYDVSGPRLTDLSVPGSGNVGDPLAYSVRPVDIWSPVASTTWSFGDGATSDGPSVTHAYGSAGARTVGVTATDALGNTSKTSASVSVAERPPPGGAAPDRAAPIISQFALTRRTFAAITSARATATKVAGGTTFKLMLSEPASATITIRRESPGLRRGKRCLPVTAARREAIRRTGGARGLRRARCTRLVRSGALKRSALAGRNSIPFSGRLSGRALAPARYRASVVATDTAGNAASRGGVRFRIVRAR